MLDLDLWSWCLSLISIWFLIPDLDPHSLSRDPNPVRDLDLDLRFRPLFSISILPQCWSHSFILNLDPNPYPYQSLSSILDSDPYLWSSISIPTQIPIFDTRSLSLPLIPIPILIFFLNLDFAFNLDFDLYPWSRFRFSIAIPMLNLYLTLNSDSFPWSRFLLPAVCHKLESVKPFTVRKRPTHLHVGVKICCSPLQ
jgi:hypothetical protein